MSTDRSPGQDVRRVSVVIPAYRSAATIRRAIDSVLGQTRSPAEIIVVDDGSPDDQASMVEQCYGSRVILIRQPNSGAASARNAGIERSTGDYLAFLDADDYWEADKLALQLGLFDQHPSLGLVAGTIFEEVPGRPRAATPVVPGPKDWHDNVLRLDGFRAFRLATMISTISVLLTRAALGAERFMPDLETAEDRDLWVRLVSRSPAYLMRHPVATAVLTEGSISRSNIDRDKANMLRVVERHRALLGPIGSRVWRSYVLYTWASVDPTTLPALRKLMASVATWPFPYAPYIDGHRFGRLRRALWLLAWTAGAVRRETAARRPL